jgi:glycosyltransferase involved in cell wall biosynthesis
MKVLHVIAGLAPRNGGPHKAAPEMCRAMARRGHEMAIFTTNMDGDGVLDVPTDRPVYREGITIRYFPIGIPRHYKCSWPLARALRDHIPDFDIVHVHSLYLFHTLVAAHFCRKYGVPYLMRPHSTLDPFIRRKSRVRKAVYNLLIEKRNLDCAAAIHYTAHEEMELAHGALGIRAPGAVVPLGIDLNEYADLPPEGEFHSLYPATKDRHVILFLSRITPKKGLDLLARAYGSVARAREDVHLVIAGPDDEGYGRRVRRWFAEEGASERVTFTGMLLGREKLAALRDADLLVLPSYAENFGVAVVEAMTCALPVVISNKVNIWREIDQGRAGIVIGCDEKELSRALIRLLEDGNLRRELGENGRRLVEAKFTWTRAAEQLEALYESILTGARERKGVAHA